MLVLLGQLAAEVQGLCSELPRCPHSMGHSVLNGWCAPIMAVQTDGPVSPEQPFTGEGPSLARADEGGVLTVSVNALARLS